MHGQKMQASRTKQENLIMLAFVKSSQIAVSFRYSTDLVEFARTIPGRRWNARERLWVAPFHPDTVDMLRDKGFEISKKLENKYKEATKPKKKLNSKSKIAKALYPFQREGVEFIESKNGRALIADEMGLGKTIQALAYLDLHPELRPAIIVCPASVKLNWQREIIRWLNIKPQVISGKNLCPLVNDIIVINYDILASHLPTILQSSPKCLIIDEAHFIKNRKAKRTKAVQKLAAKIDYVIALTGTPVINKPIEIHPTLAALRGDLYGYFWGFAKEYCNPKKGQYGWTFDCLDPDKLHKDLTSKVMIRHKKEDVLTDLPEKQRSVVPMQMSMKGKREYDQASSDLIGWIRENEGQKAADRASAAKALVEFAKLKQAAVSAKLEYCIAWIEDYLETEDKLVVFCTHHNTIDVLMQEFDGKAVKLDGRDSVEKRQKAIDDFQTKKSVKLFIGNIKAAGVGITLTAAKATAFIELGWTAAEHDQAEDRVHRIGQKADSVQTYYLLAAGTIEEDIAEILDKKRQMVSKIIDGQEVEEQHLITELLRRIER